METVQFTPVREGDKVEEIDARENLIFDLTDADILKIADIVANISKELREKEAKLHAIQKDMKDSIKGLESDLRFHHKLIETKKEGRDVDCVCRKNYTRGIVQYVFNGVVMKERAMDSYEQQKGGRPQDNTTSVLNA